MYTKVAVCIDGSEESKQAFKASIHDRQHIQEFYILYFPKPTSGVSKDDELSQGLALCRQYAKELPSDFGAQLHIACVISDKPKETATAWVKENNVDAVYVGSRGRGAITRFFLGSFSSYLCNHVKSDVLVVTKHKGGSTLEKQSSNVKEKDAPLTTQLKIRPLVICGPSGVGKGALLDGMLLREFPEMFGKSVSHTTRQPRKGEEDGHHYHFITVEEFQDDLEKGRFLEHAKVHENFYGTSVAAVEQVAMTGRICLLEIDIQGAEAILHKSDLTPNFVFIVPPSMEALEARLRSRGSESDETLQRRLATARRELEYYEKCSLKHARIINDKLDEAYANLRSHLFTLYPQLAAAAQHHHLSSSSSSSSSEAQ